MVFLFSQNIVLTAREFKHLSANWEFNICFVVDLITYV